MKTIYDGLAEYKKSIKNNNATEIVLQLIADTAIWVSPEIIKEIINKNGTVTVYKNCRRKRHNEEKGLSQNGENLDDNTKANQAIKRLIDSSIKFENYSVCHIYPNTCYDSRYHTAIPNLVLLPKPLASLTDFDQNVQSVLMFRSYELYGWFPQECGAPAKPKYYPNIWKKFIKSDFTKNIGTLQTKKIVQNANVYEVDKLYKINGWSQKQDQVNSKIVRAALSCDYRNGIPLIELETMSVQLNMDVKKFKRNYNQMKTNSGNSNAKIFIERDLKVYFDDNAIEEILKFKWELAPNKR